MKIALEIVVPNRYINAMLSRRSLAWYDILFMLPINLYIHIIALGYMMECQEKLEKERAACVERAKNKVAQVHRVAEEQRALVEANHGKEIVKAEEIAAKCRAGRPTRRFPFFS